MKDAIKLLQHYTEKSPPGENRNHALTLHEETGLCLSLWFEGQIQNVYITGEDLEKEVEWLIQEMDKLLEGASI